MEKPTINGMYAVNYAYKKMIEKGLEPIFIGEKMNKHGENCACERCSAFEKHFDEFMEKANKEVELIAELTQFMEDSVWEKDSNDRTNFLNNTFKVLGYDYQKTIPDNIHIANTLHKIVNDKNFETLKNPIISDEKALAFYNENKQTIMQNIQSEARDFGYTEQKMLNLIYEGQKCQDGNEIQKEIALARYAIFQVAENFENTIQYGVADESKSFAIRQFNKHYENETIKEYNEWKKRDEQTQEIILYFHKKFGDYDFCPQKNGDIVYKNGADGKTMVYPLREIENLFAEHNVIDDIKKGTINDEWVQDNLKSMGLKGQKGYEIYHNFDKLIRGEAQKFAEINGRETINADDIAQALNADNMPTFEQYRKKELNKSLKIKPKTKSNDFGMNM